MRITSSGRGLALGLLLAGAATTATAAPFLLVSGRWDNTVLVIRYAAITGAPRGQPGSGVLWVVDIALRKVVGRVAGVGNETYLLALLP